MRKMRSYILCLLCVLATCSQLLAQSTDSSFLYTRTTSFSLADASSNTTSSLKKIATGKPLLALIFLSPECPLCKNYTSCLNVLEKQFTEEVTFAGIIPGKAYAANLVAGFAKKYKVAYPLLIDTQKKLSNYLHASVTPEVILLNAQYQIVYKGAIDNRVRSLGVTKSEASENYLSDAISQYLHHNSVTVKNVKAIGCLINDF